MKIEKMKIFLTLLQSLNENSRRILEVETIITIYLKYSNKRQCSHTIIS